MFNLIYERYLHELTYVNYLPNSKHQMFTKFNKLDQSIEIVTEKGNNYGSYTSHVPIYGKIMYWLYPIFYILSLPLIVIAFFICIKLYVLKDELKYKWILMQILFFLIIIGINLNIKY
jgi:hypothetical protein